MEGCATCGAASTAGAHFCSSCGAVLSAPDVREERKLVSILFVDLVEFTAHSDHADPEDVRDLLRRYHAFAREQIEGFGGVVEKFIGDAVMAVFGAPYAHSDDAERAVRAGLRVVAGVPGLISSDGASTLTARGAVNTGEAVVTISADGRSGEALAMGDVVNTASRLQTAAPPGGVLVSEETYRGTRHVVTYEPRDAVHAKGKAEPLPVWQAVSVGDPGAPRRRETPFAGRADELGVLESVWVRAARDLRPQLVTVFGEAGAGKSRLAREFADRVVAEGGRVVRGRCLPYDTTDVYGAFAQQLRSLAGIDEHADALTARAHLETLVAAIAPPAELGEMVRALSLLLGLGIDPPLEEQLLLLFTARRFVDCVGQEQPTLFVFEDVHWADAALVELIDYLAGHVRDTSVLFLSLARPELLDTRPDWGRSLASHAMLSLDSLSRDDAAALVSGLLAGTATSPEAVSRIVEVAGGNPLFLEELTAAMVEGLDDSALPTTVRAAIASRVDALDAGQRSVLLAAAVVGRVFWVGALRALGHDDGLPLRLDELEAKDLIRRQPSSSMPGDIEFLFRHMLIRDVCYATLTRSERATTHARVASYIEDLTATSDRDLAGLLAHHWECAGERAQAVRYLLRAAERAQDAVAENDVLSMLDHALEIAPDETIALQVRFARALALDRFENFDAAREALQPLLDQLTGLNRVEALLTLARICHWTERTDDTIDIAESAYAEAQAMGASDLVSPALARLSQGYAMRGGDDDLDRAVEVGERALSDWVPGVRPTDLAEHRHLLADQHYWTGNYARTLELSRIGREESVDPTSAEALLRAGGMEAMVLATTGHYEDALAHFDKVIALGREMDRPVRVLLNYSTLAYRELLDLDEARRRSEESLSQGGWSSFHMPWMNAEVDLIQTDMLAGEIGTAQTRWDRMWEDVIATPAWERWLLGGKMAALRAELGQARGETVSSVEWGQRALHAANRVRRKKYQAVAHADLGHALLDLGRHEDAIAHLRTAVERADELASPAGRWRANAALGRVLYGIGDDDGAERHLRVAAEDVRSIADRLNPERAERFLAAEPLRDLIPLM